MKIGLLGFDFSSSNKGCEALTYSFVNMLKECITEELEIYTFGYGGLGIFPEQYPEIKFVQHRLKMKNPMYWLQLKHMFDELDCVFDITYGDGFSDIYGKVWNVNTNMAKQIAISSSTPFILLPQTYGPYENSLLKRWALQIVRGADYAFSRDLDSAKEMNQKIGDKVVATTDLAFALPYQKSLYEFEKCKLRIGFNVSSLLWEKGHGIKLETDYQEYCRVILKKFSMIEGIEVHLIPHVIDKNDYMSLENDSRICQKLHKEFLFTKLAPDFDTPIEAKSYISNMEVFIGARMHSTIGAISSGVVTIPFSYSKKFEGLFGYLHYPYIISATKVTTEKAVLQTMEYIEKREELKKCQVSAMSRVDEKLNLVREQVKRI